MGTCTASGCANYTGIRILPNVRSLRYNVVSRLFYAAYHMTDSGNPYGLLSTDSDSHMMKNSDWGAVTYLALSKYGINDAIRVNNQNAYNTGCGAATPNAGSNATCSNKYANTVTSFPQSTTGNVTGIFDMVGCGYDYVMGVYNKVVKNSGFSPIPDSKYYDNYPSAIFNGDATTNFGKCTLEYCGGHALNETYKWFGATGNFLSSDYPWIMRGGYMNDTTNAHIIRVSRTTGAANAQYGTRYVLIAKN